MQRLFLGLILIGLIWAIGLAIFITNLPEPSRRAPAAVDGVVVYTGGGGARITAGMTIFASGAGDRLLISGVNPETSRERLSVLWTGAPDMFECCVDLGHDARSTQGNADETAGWAKDNKYNNIVLITSDYHMPRAIALSKAAMPDTVITPFVVSSGYLGDDGRPQSLQAWRKLAGEYTKYLLARVKALFSTLGL